MKRLSKTLWYGSEVDKAGNPVLPNYTSDPNNLNGLHKGEVYLHLGDKVTIWSVSRDNRVVPITSANDIDLTPYLLKDIWDSVWEIRTNTNGVDYLFGKLPIVTQYGVTTFADDGDLNIKDIYDGLPIDQQTLIRDDNGVFKVNISNLGGFSQEQLEIYLQENEYATLGDIDNRIDELVNGAPAAFDTLKEIADVLEGNVDSIGDILTTLGTKADKTTKITAGSGLSGGGTLASDRTLSLALSGVSAGTYKSVTVDTYGRVTSGTNPTTLAGYGITDAYTKTSVDELLKKYVTLSSKQTITGEKDFTGGLKVNGCPIVYDSINKYWKFEGDLLVTGGVTSFASNSAFTPSTIMDGVNVDNKTIIKNQNGALEVIATGGGSSIKTVSSLPSNPEPNTLYILI